MLVVIIVNWNVRDLLRECLRSLARYPATGAAQRVVVVDNASSDGSVDMVRREFPDVELIASAANLGFTGGNNLGLARAEQLFPRGGDNYLLLLNPDAEVTAGALDALLAFAGANPDAGVVGPQLRYADGTIQSSRRRFPTLATALFESTWLQPLAPARLLDRYTLRDQPDHATGDADWLVGAALLVRQSVYAAVGGLDDRTFFMYSEELDWCRRIRSQPIPGQPGRTWRVVYHPAAVVIHHEGQSSGQVSARRMILFNTSKVRYFAKHHSRAQARLIRAALLAMFAEQTLVEGVKWLLGHRRSLRAERIRAYRAVLKSGLK